METGSLKSNDSLAELKQSLVGWVVARQGETLTSCCWLQWGSVTSCYRCSAPLSCWFLYWCAVVHAWESIFFFFCPPNSILMRFLLNFNRGMHKQNTGFLWQLNYVHDTMVAYKCHYSIVECYSLSLSDCDPMDCSPSGSSVHGILRQEYWNGLPCSSPGDPLGKNP